jgi:sugar (pentulose or hexulose) kinase
LKSSLQKPSKSTRIALLDLKGQVVTSTSTPQEMITPRPGWAEQGPDIWWRNALDNIHKTMEQAEATSDEILAVGVCGQMHATVPLSKDGELLSDGMQLWCDKRSADLAGNTGEPVHSTATSSLLIDLTDGPQLPLAGGGSQHNNEQSTN